MSSILVVDDMAIFRDPIAASLRLAGYTTFTAKDGTDGLAQLRMHGPDLVLLDVSMPGLDGMSFLRAMRRDPHVAKTPVILLTALMDKKFVLEAARLGVRDYLLKSRFSLKELNDRIKRVLTARATSDNGAKAGANAAASTSETAQHNASNFPKKAVDLPQPERFDPENHSPLLNSHQCISRVEDCMAGKTLSGAVSEVLMLASRPSAELKDLSALITRDPVLSVRVLQMANSAAFFSRRGAVTTITEAVKNIGANNVRNIAASVGIFDAMPASSPDGFNPIRCWQHSFAVARLCEAFVAPTAPQEAGVAYLVGLCHDLGEIMFRTQFEHEYKSVLDLQQRTGASLDEIERHLLGMTHTDILKVILKCMGLPDTIRTPIESLQNNLRPTAGLPTVSRALALAENYANGLLLVSSESSMIFPITTSDWMEISGKSKLAKPDGEEIRSQVYCLTAILSRMNADQQASITKLPFKKSKAAIWLARNPVFGSADPMAEALKELATVEVHDHLPTPDELKKFTGLAIEGQGANPAGWSLQNIQACRGSDSRIPVLWLTDKESDTPPDQAIKPVQAISLRDIQNFIAQAMPSQIAPSAIRAAA